MSLLPGSILRLPTGARCDQHPDRPAFKCRAGEVDSFGAEERFLCWHCNHSYERWKVRNQNGVQGWCDWCKHEATTIQPFRDFEEGTHGPVYDVCESCRKNYHERLREELRHEDDDQDYEPYDPGDYFDDAGYDPDIDDPLDEQDHHDDHAGVDRQQPATP